MSAAGASAAAAAGYAAACPVCDSPLARAAPGSAALSVRRCRDCGHRVAQHAAPGRCLAADYHEQYEHGAYTRSLDATRRRQALCILASLRRHLPDAGALLDFGAGRGVLLQLAREQGLVPLCGADTSPAAVAGLAARGFEAVRLLEPGAGARLPVPALPFRPRVLTLLDVIEHFPVRELGAWLRELVGELGPELVVIKVPVSDGFFFRAAEGLARLGVGAPLEQLYQVGTLPAHQHYFSRRSLRALLARLGLELLELERDLDFEPATFSGRVRAARRLPRPLAVALGWICAGLARSLGWQDSAIVFARAPRR